MKLKNYSICYGISFITLSFTMGFGCGDSEGTTGVSTSTEGMTDTDTETTGTDTEAETETGTDTEQEISELMWNIDGLIDLGPDFVYEGWILVEGSPVSVGRFGVDENGTPSVAGAKIDRAQIESATKFILSIEPEPDEDPGPSATKLLAGDFMEKSAQLTIADASALGNDFGMESTNGQYALITPSTEDNADYEQGIWWFDPSVDPPVSTLTLPALPAGWQYEGWVEAENMIQSTGKFTDPNSADSDGAGDAKGPVEEVPNFPGQDFIEPSLVLTVQGVARISIEPEPDNSPDRFLPLEILHDRPIDVTQEQGVLQSMMNIEESGEVRVNGTVQFE